MSSPKIEVHFSPTLVARIGSSETAVWADAVRNWHHSGDLERNFGRNVSNGIKASDHTWAWHVHFAPHEDPEMAEWDRISNPYHRTSDRLVVYSRDKVRPLKYGILLLAFVEEGNCVTAAFHGFLS